MLVVYLAAWMGSSMVALKAVLKVEKMVRSWVGSLADLTGLVMVVSMDLAKAGLMAGNLAARWGMKMVVWWGWMLVD